MKTDFTAQALADLEEIAVYIARDDPRAAEVWIEKLVDRAERAAFTPQAGRVVPEVADATIREVFLGTYRIVYRVERNRILVLTVVEGRRRLRLRER